jgi:hypothetical protein
MFSDVKNLKSLGAKLLPNIKNLKKKEEPLYSHNSWTRCKVIFVDKIPLAYISSHRALQIICPKRKGE